jgi:hypothetical protein
MSMPWPLHCGSHVNSFASSIELAREEKVTSDQLPSPRREHISWCPLQSRVNDSICHVLVTSRTYIDRVSLISNIDWLLWTFTCRERLARRRNLFLYDDKTPNKRERGKGRPIDMSWIMFNRQRRRRRRRKNAELLSIPNQFKKKWKVIAIAN